MSIGLLLLLHDLELEENKGKKRDIGDFSFSPKFRRSEPYPNGPLFLGCTQLFLGITGSAFSKLNPTTLETMAPKPFIIEITSSSSDSVAASSKAMHDVVPTEEEVTSKAKETYSDNDDCIVTGERWNKKEREENNDCVIVGETLQIKPSYGGPQPIYNLQAAHPGHVYSRGPFTPRYGYSGYVRRLCPTLPSSSSAYKPKGKLVIRAPHRNITSSSAYKPKGKLVIRTPLRNITRSTRAMSTSSSTESDRDCLDADSSTESDPIGAPRVPSAPRARSSTDNVLIGREHGYKAKGKLVIHTPLRNRAMAREHGYKAKGKLVIHTPLRNRAVVRRPKSSESTETEDWR